MPTSYTDQFYLFDPGNADGTYGTFPYAVTANVYTYIDNNNNGFIEPGNGDTINGNVVTYVWVGDTVTMNGVTITGVTFYTQAGIEYFTPTDGTVLVNGNISSATWVPQSTRIAVSRLGPPCFTAGTRIRTPDGDVPVENLAVGDLVATLDNGPQPIRWIGHKTTVGTGAHAPVCITQGALGNTRELLVSPQHRMLLQDWRAEVYFGEPQVLAAAKHLCNGDTIYVRETAEIEYFHILFDNHEIIFAEDAPSESYQPGSYLLDGDAELRQELLDLFPELETRQPSEIWRTARMPLKSAEARMLAART